MSDEFEIKIDRTNAAKIVETCDALLAQSELDAPTGSAPRPQIITICGSSRFVAESAVKAWELNKQGIATFYMPLLPQWYPGVQEHHQAEAENVAANLDNLWLELIAMSDEIFVVNCAIPGHESGYIGERTRIEINHALKLGKPVRYLVEQNE